MVTELTGKINDMEIVFTKDEKEGDIWKTDIPRLRSGEHIIELYATDTAGNKAYFATVLIYVDKDSIVQRILFIDYADKPYKEKNETQTYGEYRFKPYVKKESEDA